ncbi:hypothetical protein ACHAWF_010208 [Thalassiosira exigua]
MNAQYPVRLGVLFVDGDDAAGGAVSPVAPWDDGDRKVHARDAFLLYRYLSKEFDSRAAISCLFPHEDEPQGETTAREYLDMHFSFLTEIGVLPSGAGPRVREEVEALLAVGKVSAPDDDLTYEAAVAFASDKLLRPGMSFLNGLPLPDADDSNFDKGFSDALRYEQMHVMELVMKGVITDTAPKSIYARVLSGDKLFERYHPLLKDTDKAYSLVAPKADWRSLLGPTPKSTDYGDVDAMFLIEGAFDLDNQEGVNSAASFLRLVSSPPEAWHDARRVSVAFRMLASGPAASPRSQVLSRIFCAASQFDPEDILRLLEAQGGPASFENVAGVIDAIGQIDSIASDVRQRMQRFGAAETETTCHASKPIADEKDNFYVANGRVYVPIDDAPISISDIQMLISMEIDKTRSITQMLYPHLMPATSEKIGAGDRIEGNVIHHAIATTATILNEIMSSPSSSSSQDVATIFDSLQSDGGNPLFLSFNEESLSRLQVKISVILDPLTEPTQRVAPLLLAIRDSLKLPLKLIIAPRKIVQNDAPLSSYYRFVAEPTSLPDASPPKATFRNLPTNHLLTLRMDVPELWDVQQAHAIQDTDNLRCDARYGCGDEAHTKANEGGNDNDDAGAHGMVELTQIEYSLKSLLFFGQCYDVTKSTPPNGLQLTLDRSKPNGLSDSSDAAMQSDHTDTLVMKTVGYWQLRANPGVWDLRIAENSRGSELFYMVEGSVSTRSGKIQLAKNSAESTSKSLVMKDFTNQGRLLLVKRRKGFEQADLFLEEQDSGVPQQDSDETVHVFSLATGHAYERLLKIMMLSVTKRTSSKVKFWLFENFLSPSFKQSAQFMAKRIGCEVEFVTYKVSRPLH